MIICNQMLAFKNDMKLTFKALKLFSEVVQFNPLLLFS